MDQLVAQRLLQQPRDRARVQPIAKWNDDMRIIAKVHPHLVWCGRLMLSRLEGQFEAVAHYGVEGSAQRIHHNRLVPSIRFVNG